MTTFVKCDRCGAEMAEAHREVIAYSKGQGGHQYAHLPNIDLCELC